MKNKKGASLILVLMIMLVFSILGAALLTVSLSETRFVMHDEKKMKAYYIARAGADATAAWMEPKANTGADLVGKTAAREFENGSFTVIVSGTQENPKITSVGEFGGVSNKVTLTMKKKALFTTCIFADSDLILDNNSDVYGSVELGNTITDNEDNVHGEIEENSTDTLDWVNFPSLPGYPDSGVFSDWDITSDMTVSAASPYTEHTYNKISVKSSRTLTFNLSGNMHIVTDTLDVDNGNIAVTGSGILYLYARIVSFRGNLSALSNGVTTFLVVRPGGYVELKTSSTGPTDFDGYIYSAPDTSTGIPAATVEISANINLTGAIMADTVMLSSGGTVVYNPAAAQVFPELLGLSPLGYERGLWGRN